MNTENFAPQIIGITCMSLVVPAFAAGAFVGLGGLVITGVVAHSKQKIAVFIPRHTAARVAAHFPLGSYFEHHFF
ncbi:hypothetical protein D3C87_1773600 [compost metagenome]